MTEKKTNGKTKKVQRRPAEKKTKDKKLQEEDILIPPEVFESLPEETKGTLKAIFTMQSFSGRLPSPLVQKLTSEHISTIISTADKDNERQYKYATSSRWFRLAYSVIAIGVFLFLTVYFGKSDESLYLRIVEVLIILGGGIGIGYGYKSAKK